MQAEDYRRALSHYFKVEGDIDFEDAVKTLLIMYPKIFLEVLSFSSEKNGLKYGLTNPQFCKIKELLKKEPPHKVLAVRELRGFKSGLSLKDSVEEINEIMEDLGVGGTGYNGY
jgi:hypothetical protein